MYADRESEAMRTAIGETDRRRDIQLAYNREHGITPETITKGISDISDFLAMESTAPAKRRRSRATIDGKPIESPEDLERVIVSLEEEMLAAAEELHFEEAARLRDELKELRRDLDGDAGLNVQAACGWGGTAVASSDGVREADHAGCHGVSGRGPLLPGRRERPRANAPRPGRGNERRVRQLGGDRGRHDRRRLQVRRR